MLSSHAQIAAKSLSSTQTTVWDLPALEETSYSWVRGGGGEREKDREGMGEVGKTIGEGRGQVGEGRGREVVYNLGLGYMLYDMQTMGVIHQGYGYAWKMFSEELPVLTGKWFSFKLKDVVCIQIV